MCRAMLQCLGAGNRRWRTAVAFQNQELSRFADRVLLRTRSGTGVAVYRHDDGSLGFIARPEDIAVTRTLARTVSFRMRCQTCGILVTTCTTADGEMVSTPCYCDDERDWRGVLERGRRSLTTPATDLDSFASRVHEILTREEPFVLFSFVRAFLRSYWSMMGRDPDALAWARFYTTLGGRRERDQ